MNRYLAHAVLDRGVIHYTALLSVDGNEMSIEPFERETSSTEFFPGIIIIASSEAVTSPDKDELAAVASTPATLRQLSAFLNDYMTSHNFNNTSNPDNCQGRLLYRASLYLSVGHSPADLTLSVNSETSFSFN